MEELFNFFENYSSKSHIINLNELRASELLKLKKYKNCVYYGEIVNQLKQGKGFFHLIITRGANSLQREAVRGGMESGHKKRQRLGNKQRDKVRRQFRQREKRGQR